MWGSYRDPKLSVILGMEKYNSSERGVKVGCFSKHWFMPPHRIAVTLKHYASFHVDVALSAVLPIMHGDDQDKYDWRVV